MDSFRPIISFKRSEDGWTELFARLIALGVLAFIVYKLGQEPQIIKGWYVFLVFAYKIDFF